MAQLTCLTMQRWHQQLQQLACNSQAHRSDFSKPLGGIVMARMRASEEMLLGQRRNSSTLEFLCSGPCWGRPSWCAPITAVSMTSYNPGSASVMMLWVMCGPPLPHVSRGFHAFPHSTLQGPPSAPCPPGDGVHRLVVPCGLLTQVHLHEADTKAVQAAQEVQQTALRHNARTCSRAEQLTSAQE